MDEMGNQLRCCYAERIMSMDVCFMYMYNFIIFLSGFYVHVIAG